MKWELWEVLFLNKNAARYTYQELAERLDRRVSAVKYKCYSLKLYDKTHWTEEQVAWLRDNANRRPTELEEHLGRSIDSIRNKAIKEGIHIPRPPMFWTPDEYLQAHLAQPNENGCTLWTGPLNPHGYGRASFKTGRCLAHRFAWINVHGEIPDGLCVCHKCDVPACCNVEHLFLGTRAENVRDCITKGRQRYARRKLTGAQVREIRTRYAVGDVTQKRLSTEYGVNCHTISRIVNNRGWLSEPPGLKPVKIPPVQRRRPSTPRAPSRPLECNGETMGLCAWSRKTGLAESTIRGRLARGWDVEKTLTTERRFNGTNQFTAGRV